MVYVQPLATMPDSLGNLVNGGDQITAEFERNGDIDPKESEVNNARYNPNSLLLLYIPFCTMLHRIAIRNSARAATLAAVPKVLSLALVVLQQFSHAPCSTCRTLHLAHMQLPKQVCAYALSTLALAHQSLFFFPTTSAASEVSSILESRISGSSIGGNVEETGRVLSTLFHALQLFRVGANLFHRCR